MKVGKIHFTGVDDRVVHSNIKIKEIEKNISNSKHNINNDIKSDDILCNSKLEYNISNDNKININNGINGNITDNNIIYVIYSIVINGITYKVYVSNGNILRISTSMDSMGEILVINTNNSYTEENKEMKNKSDITVELCREKIIYTNSEKIAIENVNNTLDDVKNTNNTLDDVKNTIENDVLLKIVEIIKSEEITKSEEIIKKKKESCDKLIWYNNKEIYIETNDITCYKTGKEKNTNILSYNTQWLSDINNLNIFENKFKTIWDKYMEI